MSEALELSAADVMPSERTISFQLARETTCAVTFKGLPGPLQVQDIKRLIAMLELVRSFMCDEPLDVTVMVSSPRAQDAMSPAESGVNVAKFLDAVATKASA